MTLARLVVGLVAGVLASTSATAAPGDIFRRPSPLPYQAPEFDKIKDSDYAPAFDG